MEFRYIVLYNGKEVAKTNLFAEAYNKACLYGNGRFESIEIIDLSTGELIAKVQKELHKQPLLD